MKELYTDDTIYEYDGQWFSTDIRGCSTSYEGIQALLNKARNAEWLREIFTYYSTQK